MRYHNLSLKLFAASLLVAFVCLMPVAVAAQTQEQIRQQAMELFDANNFVAAVPLLEKSAIAYPNDVAIASRLGFALYALGTTSKDSAVRKQHWERARKVLLQSRANGDDSNLTRITLESLSREDVTAVPFSEKKAAEAERYGEDC